MESENLMILIYSTFVFSTFFYIFFILCLSTAEAYVGPGLGLGTISVVLSVLLAILLSLVAIVWYPLKRIFKKKQASKNSNAKT